MVLPFWHFIMFFYRPDEPQVKRNVISCTKNVVYELPHELANNLRLRILGKKEILTKSEIWVKTWNSAQSPFQKLKLVVFQIYCLGYCLN